jgi:hypothetical protein
MSDDVLVFTLPLPDRSFSPNGRSHWAVKHKKKNALWAMADLLVKGKINPKPPKTPWNKATIRVRCVVGAINDVDNLMARLKPTCDWLVTRGYVVDDKPKHLKWEGMPEQRVSRKNSPEIEITLTRVD